MNVVHSLLHSLQPSVKIWIQAAFPSPVDLDSVNLENIPGLYMYICNRDQSPFDASCPFAGIEIKGSKFDVLYVGETNRLRTRHLQHLQQVETCREHTLLKLIQSVLKNNPCATVLDCDLGSQFFVHEVETRQQRVTPGYRFTRRDLQNSIGWSLVRSFSWLRCDDVRTRVRAEETLIATLLPPLNWLRRYA